MTLPQAVIQRQEKRQPAEILQRVGAIDISRSSVWRQVEHWGSRFQAVEAHQQVKAYELEEPKPIDPQRSLGRMGVSMDGTMIPIREEGWKELKVGCVFEIYSRSYENPYTKETVVLGSAAKQYKARFCGSGMRWSRPGAERLFPIRSAILSHRFDKMWTLAYNSPPI